MHGAGDVHEPPVVRLAYYTLFGGLFDDRLFVDVPFRNRDCLHTDQRSAAEL